MAVVVPGRTELENWAVQNSITDNFTSLCQNPKARKYILDELNCNGQKQEVCLNPSNYLFPFSYCAYSSDLEIFTQLRGFEMLKAVHLEPNPFDMGRDMITPTYKLKRPQLLKYYKVHNGIYLYQWLFSLCFSCCFLLMYLIFYVSTFSTTLEHVWMQNAFDKSGEK